MAINITIKKPEEAEEPVEKEKIPGQPILKLNARKTLDGHIVIHDHDIMDIVIMPENNKVVVFAKDLISDDLYYAQHRLFQYLMEKGVIKRDSVQGGNVYGSMEGEFPNSVIDGVDPVQAVLFVSGKWMSKEREFLDIEERYAKEWEKWLTEPEPDESTELGEVPHEEEKGTIDPARIRRYLSGYGFYEE